MKAPQQPDATTRSRTEQPETAVEINIPGLNTQLGLKRVLGRQSAYWNLLRKYAAGQKNTIAEIGTALGSGDYDTAERLAHTLKAVSGNIGAEEVQEERPSWNAASRKRAERGPEDRDGGNRPPVDILVKELERAVPPEAVENAPSGPESPVDELLRILQELRPHMEARKPKSAPKSWRSTAG